MKYGLQMYSVRDLTEHDQAAYDRYLARVE